MNKLFILGVIFNAVIVANAISTDKFVAMVNCHECHEYVNEIVEVGHSTKFEIKPTLEKTQHYCQNYTETKEVENCHAFMSEYIEPIFAMIKFGIQEGSICDRLLFCKNEEVLTQNIASKEKDVDTLFNELFNLNDECEDCQGLVELAQQYVSEKLPEESVQDHLDSWCNLDPKYEHQCQEIVNATLPLVYQYITSEQSAEQICGLAHFC